MHNEEEGREKVLTFVPPIAPYVRVSYTALHLYYSQTT